MNIEKYTEELITLRHYFHQHPELALQEVETSAYIRKYLEKLGYEIVPIEPTGLIAELPSLRNREKLVVLRAEMDALTHTGADKSTICISKSGMYACLRSRYDPGSSTDPCKNCGRRAKNAGKFSGQAPVLLNLQRRLVKVQKECFRPEH